MNFFCGKWRLVLVFVIMLCITLWFAQELFSQTKNLEIVFLDVGQGDAILITTPNKRQIVIDTGYKWKLGSKLAPYMSFNDRSIDMLIMTHPDIDHVGAVPSLIDRYTIKGIIHSGLLAGSSLYETIGQKVQDKGIPVLSAERGQRIYLDDDVILEIYSPHPDLKSLEANDYSIIARLVYRDNSVLFMGDATKSIESDLVKIYDDTLHSDILKIGHHGSKTSTSEVFLKAINPKYAIISAGCNNRFGHPHTSILEILFRQKVEVFDTCNNGDIVFQSDGNIWIKQ